MEIKISPHAFDPWQELQDYQANQRECAGKYGATSIFVGTMRDFNDGDQVTGMHLAYYPGMTEKHLQRIADEATQQWPLLDYLVIHRVGDIYPEQPIVLVAVWTSHRGDAFDACRYVMENLKQQAPFWKKEVLDNGQSRWVAANSKGYATSQNAFTT